MRDYRVYIPIIISLVLITGIFLGSKLKYASGPSIFVAQNDKEQKIRQILNLIDYEYVDPINTDSLLDQTIIEMLHKLDPHSSYIAKTNAQKTSESLKGSFVGIGIEYFFYKDSLTVIQTVKPGPSFLAGILAGDRIVKINANPIIGLPKEQQSEIPELLRGPKNTLVELEIFRPSTSQKILRQVKRKEIPIPSISSYYKIEDGIGYIKLNRFSATSTAEIQNALRKLKTEGVEKIIIDVRDNPGGLLRQAIQVSDEFLSGDKLIVFTKDREGKVEKNFSTKKGAFQNQDLIILINENSASAAEIFAGALQDNDRATIIGRRSFGKGLVQEEVNLKDGSKVRLTTSRYYTPTGRSIQKPYGKSYEEYQSDYKNRRKNGELLNQDSIKVDESQIFKTPKGKVVYGGGGIIPDIFVPIDTSYREMGWLYHVFNYSALDKFCFQYVDKNRLNLLTGGEKSFLSSFQPDSTLFQAYFDFHQIDLQPNLIPETTFYWASARFKALLGKYLFGDAVFFQTINTTDPMIKRSLEEINKEESPE